jgi:hypothetical protein
VANPCEAPDLGGVTHMFANSSADALGADLLILLLCLFAPPIVLLYSVLRSAYRKHLIVGLLVVAAIAVVLGGCELYQRWELRQQGAYTTARLRQLPWWYRANWCPVIITWGLALLYSMVVSFITWMCLNWTQSTVGNGSSKRQ